jgi:glycogen synthase
MQILYISSEYPPETGFGGIGTYTRHCAEGMVLLGHKVHVICRAESNPAVSIVNNVIVHRIPSGTYTLPQSNFFFPFRAFCRRFIPHSLQRLAWARQAYCFYKQSLETIYKFDVIEYPECGGEGFYFSKETDNVQIVRLHTPWEMVRKLDCIKETFLDRIIIPYIERLSARKASAVTSPSNALAIKIKRQWKLKNIAVFPNPIPVSKYAITSGADWIYTGRIEYRKGIHILIEAYSLLKKTHTLPHLRLIGKPYGLHPDGVAYSDYVMDLIKKNGCHNDIEWIPGIPYSEIAAYLNKSAVAIFPSLWENFSYSCLEAMACGLAVVASECGGYKEIIIDNENGLLFEPGNIKALAEQLIKLLATPLLCQNLGINARKKVEILFDAPIICRKTEIFYFTKLKSPVPKKQFT